MTDALEEAANDPSLLEVGRSAVESVLIEFRDRRISVLGRGNGLVIRERDGADSHLIRLSTEDALAIALKAMAAELSKRNGPKP
jgi:hypothetical protein